MEPYFLSSFPNLLAFLISGYGADIISAVRGRRLGCPGLRATLMICLLGTALIPALSALGPEILVTIFGASTGVVGTSIDADNTCSVVGTVRNDVLGAFFSLPLWGLASAFGGWLGDLTSNRLDEARRRVIESLGFALG